MIAASDAGVSRILHRRVGVAVTAWVAVTIGTSGSAQETELGSRLNKRPDIRQVHGKGSTRVDAQNMLRCIADSRTDKARRYLAQVRDTEIEKIGPGLFRPLTNCVYIDGSDFSTERQVGWSRDVGRGALAEALLAKTPRPAPLVALALQKQYHSPWAEVSGRDIVVEEMAVCVAATNPSGIDALLRTSVESDAEKAAVAALGPWLGPCLSATAILKANRASLRAALAEALYHRVAADAPAELVEKK